MSRIPLSSVPIKTEPISPAIVEEIETFEAEDCQRGVFSGMLAGLCLGIKSTIIDGRVINSAVIDCPNIY